MELNLLGMNGAFGSKEVDIYDENSKQRVQRLKENRRIFV
jgi:hypothetical protein